MPRVLRGERVVLSLAFVLIAQSSPVDDESGFTAVRVVVGAEQLVFALGAVPDVDAATAGAAP